MSTVTELADELTGLLFESQPLWPSLLGLPGDHGKLADLSADAESVARAAFLDVADRAAAIDPASLPVADLATRDLVIQQAKAAVDTIDSGVHLFAVSDDFTAPALRLLQLMPVLTLNDDEKTRGYLARLAAIPSYLDTVTERQRAALGDGLVPPEFLVDTGIAYLERYLGDPDNDPLRIGGEEITAERDRLLAEAVRPAYTRYRDFLATEVKPVSLADDKPGLCWLPGGAERYDAMIRVHTTTERTARELHETGLAMIDALRDEYRELGSRVFGIEDLDGIFERLRTDPALRWNDGEEMLEAARSAVERAEAVAPQWFSVLPEESCEVRAVPATQAEGGTMAYYIEPALDGSRAGVYYANTFEAHERFRHTAEAIAFHETVPGHHLQLSTCYARTELPLLNRIAEVTAYIEGWGLYSERLADEMGLYSADVHRFGILTQDSMRAGRLVVDTGMHALGWSRRQAVEYLRDNTPMAPLEIEAEIDRYAACPGQALAYMVGRLEIQRIRREAERALGDRFDIRAFHDMVLGNGNLPLSVLDTVASRWVAAHE